MSAPTWSAPRYEVELTYVGATTDIEYVGFAEPGAATSDAAWAVAKLLYDGSSRLVSVRWADRNRFFDKVWDDRATYAYS